MAGQFLQFIELPQDMRKETKVWVVKSAQGDRTLGQVRWHAPWRRYTFQPLGNTVFDAECLAKIASWCGSETVAQKETWKGRG